MPKINVTTISGKTFTMNLDEQRTKDFIIWYGGPTNTGVAAQPSSWQPNVFSHEGEKGTVYIKKDRVDYFTIDKDEVKKDA